MKAVHDIVARHQDQPGALLPVLHDVQDTLGFIPDEAVAVIATALNLSRAEVHGVVTYYQHFRRHAVGRHVVQICRAEACQAMGAQALLDHAQETLGCKTHGLSPDDLFTLEPVYCLGLCATSPAIMIDQMLHARVTPDKFDALIAELEASAEIERG